jgi:hypothetical protein
MPVNSSHLRQGWSAGIAPKWSVGCVRCKPGAMLDAIAREGVEECQVEARSAQSLCRMRVGLFCAGSPQTRHYASKPALSTKSVQISF